MFYEKKKKDSDRCKEGSGSALDIEEGIFEDVTLKGSPEGQLILSRERVRVMCFRKKQNMQRPQDGHFQERQHMTGVHGVQ